MLRIIRRSLPHGKNFSLELHAGEILFIQGPNGTGKSLLLKSIANLIPGKSEEFLFNQQKISEMDYTLFRSQVMYAATVSYFPTEGSVEDFLNAPFKLEVHAGKKPSLSTDEWLKKWNMTGLLLSQLSSGQKQIVGILRVLSLDPKLLLLDEPTSHLDAQRTLEIESLVKDWLKRSQGSLIVVGHDLEQPKRFGGKILKIEEAWV